MGKMLAARDLAPNRIEPVEVTVPILAEGEAWIELEACGICGSEISMWWPAICNRTVSASIPLFFHGKE